MAFTPVEATCGGLLIGLATAVQLLCFGRVLGFSGLYAATLQAKPASWRLLVLGGMVLGGGLAYGFVQEFPPPTLDEFPSWLYALGGLLTGFGTNVGCGCTSGHGIVGLARFSKRSLVAVLTFMAAGALATHVTLTLTSGSDRQPSIAPFQAADAPAVIGVTLGAAGVLLASVAWAYAANSAAARASVYVCTGVTSALALALSGMTNQRKVQGFLDVAGGEWDPSLAFVMGGGLLVSVVAHVFARRWSRPLLAASFAFPPTADFGSTDGSITVSLVLGSLCFGFGWGVVGLCPGPVFVGQVFPFSPTAGKGAMLFPFWLVWCGVGTLLSDHVLGRVDVRREMLTETEAKFAPVSLQDKTSEYES